MKTGRSLQEVMIELDRQSKAKRDFIGQAETVHRREDGKTCEINHMLARKQEVFGTTQLFHRQVASTLVIPARY